MPVTPPSLFPPILPLRHGMLPVDEDYTVRFALNTFF